MIKAEKILEIEKELLKQTGDLQQVISSYLQQDLELSDDEVEKAGQTAEMIIESARIYTENRDNALKTGIVKDNKDIIRSQMEDMDWDEAEDYLSKLNVLLQKREETFLPDGKVLEEECRNLRESLSGMEPQKRIDQLMELLDLDGMDRYALPWEYLGQNEMAADVLAGFAAEGAQGDEICLTWQQAAVRGAVLYKELMKKEEMTPQAAALVTGQVAKLSDEVSVSVQNQAGRLTDEEAKTILGAVGNGWGFLFFCVLWTALFILSFFLPFPLVHLFESVNLAMIVYFIVALGCMAILFDNTGKLYALVMDCMLNLKRLWNKTAGSVIPAMKISNSGFAYWS